MLNKNITPLYLKEVIEFYGCWRCGVCCIINDVQLLNGEEQKIIKQAENQNMDLDFLGKHLRINKKEARQISTYALTSPCVFLEDRACSIYENRPVICSLFPFQIPDDRNIIITSYTHCPLATQIIDEIFDNAGEPSNWQSLTEPGLRITQKEFMEFFEKRKSMIHTPTT